MSYNEDLSILSGQMTSIFSNPIELSSIGREVGKWLKQFTNAYACLSKSNASVCVELDDMHIDGCILGASTDCVLVSEETTKNVYFIPNTSIKYIRIVAIPGLA